MFLFSAPESAEPTPKHECPESFRGSRQIFPQETSFEPHTHSPSLSENVSNISGAQLSTSAAQYTSPLSLSPLHSTSVLHNLPFIHGMTTGLR